MKIKKILNNNAVCLQNDLGVELIVMGKGIGFKKKIGDFVDENLVEKRFNLENNDEASKIFKLIDEIDLAVFKITNEIMAYARSKNFINNNEFFYFSLLDHINGVIERKRQGYLLKNQLLYEIKSFYPIEYDIGTFAIESIFKETKIELENDEAGFIAAHFIGNNFEEKLSMTPKILKIVQEILNIIKYNFIVVFDESDFYYQRFLNHLKFFATRIILKKNIAKFKLSEMQNIIFKTYPKIEECIIKIVNFISKVYKYNVSENEKLYLSIHLTTLVKIMEEKNEISK